MAIMQLNLPYIVWSLTSFAKKLGVWGLLGLLLLLISIFAYGIKVPLLNAQITTLKIEQAKQAKANALDSVNKHEPIIQNTEEEVSKFYSRFPSVHLLPEVLAELNKIAKNNQIELTIGDYKFTEIKTKKEAIQRALTKYELIFPIQGTYAQIRSFVSQALKALPEMALLDLQVVRESPSVERVDARLVFVVFVKGDEWANDGK
jgi:Tfp pilus assembly protein PilO